MDVMNRKLFADRSARKRLRDMGGIMSSFPELAGEVQRVQDGGPVTYGQWQAMSRSEREAAGLPVSLIGGQLHFNRFGVGLGRNDPETGERLVEPATAAGSAVRLDTRPERTPPTEEEIAAASRGSVDRAATRDVAPRADEAIAEASEVTEDMTAAAEAAAARLEPEEIETARTDYEALLAAEGTDPEETTPEDLETLARRRIELYQRLFGEDEPTPRDRGMQLAMIGLAIAAGQSPNAMTNIASGALAGLQAMSAQEAERRARARDLRESAVSGVLREQAEERERERALRREEQGALRARIGEAEDAYREAFSRALGDAGPSGLTDPAAAADYAHAVASRHVRTVYGDIARLIPSLVPESGAGTGTSAAPLRAVNPTTGETIVLRDGRWVPE